MIQIIIGIVAVRSPGLSFAREAFKELGAAVELFEKADFHPVTRHGVVRSFFIFLVPFVWISLDLVLCYIVILFRYVIPST